MVKAVIAAAIGAFLVFYILTSPDQAAEIAKGIGHLVARIAHGIAHFVNKLAT